MSRRDDIENEPHLREGPGFGDNLADEPWHHRSGANLENIDDGIAGETLYQKPGAPGPFTALFAAAKASRTWPITFLAAVLGGPIAVVTAFLGSVEHSAIAILNVVIIGPTIEEVAKNLPCIWLCERRPWLLPSRIGIALAALTSGLVFAILENILYLHVYVTDPSPALIQWRWTVCVALHMGCALIGSLGVARAWTAARLSGQRGSIDAMVPAIVAATVIHGTYNLLAVVMESLRPF